MALLFSKPERQRFVQIAYHVADIDRAMARWHAAVGVGPFLLRRHIPLEDVRYRGQSCALDISAAMAQSGDVQIELVQQHCDSPSTFRDMFDRAEEGLHHLAIAPDDGPRMLDHYQTLGFDVATSFLTSAGGGADYVDARPLFGHMIEIYRISDRIVRLYDRVADEAERWDRRELVIELEP